MSARESIMPTNSGDPDEQDEIVRRLEEAVANLRNDLAKVEFWACAVHGFAQPVPEYDTDKPMLLFDIRGPASAPRRRVKLRRARSGTKLASA
jgi:hypothetical protein